MKKTVFFKAVALVFFGVIIAEAGFAQQGDNFKPAAQVNLVKTEQIMIKQFRDQLNAYQQARGRAPTPAEKRQILDGMIDEKLILQDAEKNKVIVSDAELNKYIDQLRSQLAQSLGHQPSDVELNTAIREQTGMDLASYKEGLRKQMVFQKYLPFKKPDLAKSIKPPTEEEIAAFYNLHKAEIVRPDMVRCSMILVPFGTDSAAKNQAKAKADELVKTIGTNPSKFDEMLMLGKKNGYQGGDFGYIPRTSSVQQVMGDSFVNAAFKLKQGEVSPVIETKRGYSIIKITESYEQKALSLDDVFQVGSDMTVREYIGNGLYQERQQEVVQKAIEDIVKELRKAKPFMIYEDNISSIING
jgi:parvulin-like peptidyl-prolyl isomerase